MCNDDNEDGGDKDDIKDADGRTIRLELAT